jgi:hypothetical protein
MTPETKFEVTIPQDGPSNHTSAVYNSVAPRGQAVGAHSTDPDQFALAQHNNFIGHLMRDVTLEGLTLEDRVFGRTSDTPAGLEGPAKVGDHVSARQAVEIELEGPEYLWLSGTGALSSGTAVPANLSYLHGRLRVSQGSEQVNYTLVANNLDPSEEGALRIRARRVGH